MLRPLLCYLLTVSCAHAGPWSRGTGNGFLSITYETPFIAESRTDWAGLYFEYGLTDQWTLGVDAGSDLHENSFTVAFLRYPIQAPNLPLKFAAEVAVGAVQTGSEISPMIRPGLSIGRGWQIADFSGWATLDLQVSFETETKYWLSKAEGTVGVNLGEHLKFIAQITGERTSLDQTYHALNVGTAYAIQPGFYIISSVVFYSQDRPSTYKIGSWLTF